MRTFLLTFLGGLAALVVFFVLIPLVLHHVVPALGRAPSARRTRCWRSTSARCGRTSRPPIRSAPPSRDVLVRRGPAAAQCGGRRSECEGRLRARRRDGHRLLPRRGTARRLPAPARGGQVRHRPHAGLPRDRARRPIAPSPPRTRSGCSRARRSRRRASRSRRCSLAERSTKLKVEPEIEQFYEFKNAADVYKRHGLFGRRTRSR